jgi:hypothetical protein
MTGSVLLFRKRSRAIQGAGKGIQELLGFSFWDGEPEGVLARVGRGMWNVFERGGVVTDHMLCDWLRGRGSLLVFNLECCVQL